MESVRWVTKEKYSIEKLESWKISFEKKKERRGDHGESVDEGHDKLVCGEIRVIRTRDQLRGRQSSL